MQSKRLAEFIDSSDQEAYDASGYNNLVVIKPNFGDFLAWQTALASASTDPNKAAEVFWIAVNACVRNDKGAKQWLTIDDFNKGEGRLIQSIAVAANKYLTEYATEGKEKKET